MNASSFTETRTYNANLQLTSLVSGTYQYSYNYSATQNNGRIQSVFDAASGETVTYQYDSLNRLIQASGTGDPQGVVAVVRFRWIWEFSSKDWLECANECVPRHKSG